MKLSIGIAALIAICTSDVSAFAPSGASSRTASLILENMADDVGIPCEEECALDSYPNLPPSVHPGVLSGQAIMDLLQHAKDNGEKSKNHCIALYCDLCFCFTLLAPGTIALDLLTSVAHIEGVRTL